MNKHFKRFLSLLFAFFVCIGGICNHVHTDECGENGVDCTHECGRVDPDENQITHQWDRIYDFRPI